MKRTITVFRCFLVMLCLFAGLQTVQAGRSSNVTINAKNSSLQTVLREIERQSDYRFSYKDADLKGFPAVTANFRNAPVTNVLDKIFNNTKLSYEVVSQKSIVIVPRKASSTGSNAGKTADAARTASGYRNISGVVTDSEGEPVTGASVQCVGAKGVGTTTDVNGAFSLRVPDNVSKLLVSYIGMEPAEVSATDGSSRFPKKHRFGFFPSFSAGWRISQEKFMESLHPVLSDLKFRASWGSIGNQAVSDNYPYIPSMGIYQTTWLVNDLKPTTLSAPGLVSANFSWEKVYTLDFAVDFAFFNNRLSGTAEWYRRDTKDMLAPGMDLPWVIGATPARQNAADLRTKGWELSLRWQDRIDQVNYWVGFNIFDSTSKITKYRNETKLLTTYYEGMNIGEIWGYTTDRFYTADDFNDDGTLKDGIPKPYGAGTMNPGDVLYVDYDGDGKIYSGEGTAENPGDRRVIGNTTPRYQYGIRAGFTWKGFDFSMFFHGVGKRDYWRTDQLAWPNGSWGVNFKETLDFWSEENPNAFFPRTYANNVVNTSYNRWTQTKYLADASFFRLQNVTLAYSLPKNVVSRLFIENLRNFVTGENLKTWDHLPKGLEPEMISNGAWTYPYMRKISFGINLTL